MIPKYKILKHPYKEKYVIMRKAFLFWKYRLTDDMFGYSVIGSVDELDLFFRREGWDYSFTYYSFTKPFDDIQHYVQVGTVFKKFEEFKRENAEYFI